MTGVRKEFIRYTSQNILGMMALSCYILADTFFVSLGLGSNGLAALNLSIPVYSFIHGSGLMVGMGGGTRYSILKSQENHQEANRAFTHVLYMAAVLAAFFLALGPLAAGDLVTAFGGTGEVFTMSKTYLQVLLMFAPAFLLNDVLICFVRNDGAPQLAMTAMVVGSLANVVLDWVLIFPCGLGIFGAAFATGLAPLIGIGILSTHIFRKRNQFHFVPCRPRARLMGRIITSGVPSLVTELSSGIVIIVFNALIMNLEGNVGVAAYGVIANLSLVVVAIYTGIAQGIQPILSRNYGRGDWECVSAILRYAMITMLGISVVVYGAVTLFTSQIAAIFNSEGNATLQAIAEQGLRLYFIACPFAGCNVVLSIYFTSTDRPMPAHVISLLRGIFLILPMAFLLAWLGDMVGIWLTFPVTEFLVAALAGVLFLRSKQPVKRKIGPMIQSK
ncbi:MAG: MATE family efflux transporter [Acutalibacter sp.]|jgi:putative MATE family efflux protein